MRAYTVIVLFRRLRTYVLGSGLAHSMQTVCYILVPLLCQSLANDTGVPVLTAHPLPHPNPTCSCLDAEKWETAIESLGTNLLNVACTPPAPLPLPPFPHTHTHTPTPPSLVQFFPHLVLFAPPLRGMAVSATAARERSTFLSMLTPRASCGRLLRSSKPSTTLSVPFAFVSPSPSHFSRAAASVSFAHATLCATPASRVGAQFSGSLSFQRLSMRRSVRLVLR